MTLPPDPISRGAFELRRGPWPGLLGDVVAMHGRYYAANWQFPVVFEAKVADIRTMGEQTGLAASN